MDLGHKEKKKYLEKGLSKLHKAAEADDDDRLPEALELYIKGTGHLYNSLQYDNHTEAEKRSLHGNYMQYLDRIDKLEKIIDERKRKKKEKKKHEKEKKPLFKFQQNQSFEEEYSTASLNSPQTARNNRLSPSPTRKNAPSTGQRSVPASPKPREEKQHLNNSPPITNQQQVPRRKGPPPPLPNSPPHSSEEARQRRSPPPVPLSARPTMGGGSATLDRKRLPPKEPPQMTHIKRTLSPSSSLPSISTNLVHDSPFAEGQTYESIHHSSSSANLKSKTLPRNASPMMQQKQVVQVHRAPETHSSGTLLRIHDKYLNNNNRHPPVQKRGSQEGRLDSDTLTANAMTIVSMATKEDLKGNYKDALHKYEDGVKLFCYILKEYPFLSGESRDSIRSKCMLYQDRIDTIKGMISNITRCQQKKKSSADEVKIEEEYREIITTEKADIKWSNVAGVEHAKDILATTIISPIKFPQLFMGTGGVMINRSVLLYGPPGSGKSYLSKAVGCEASGASYFYVKVCDLFSKYHSNVERLIQVLFQKTREHQPSILILDDLEYLQYSENESDAFKLHKQELTRQITAEENHGVFVIAVTNAPWNLDASLRNSFDKNVGLTLPDLPARIKILNMHLKEISHSLNERQMAQLAHHTERYSGADICSLVNDAWMQPVRRLQAARYFRKVRSESHQEGAFVPCRSDESDAIPITLSEIDVKDLQESCLSYEDVVLSLQSIKYSVTSADLLKFEDYTKSNI